MTDDPLAPLRRLVAHPQSLPDDRTRLRAAVILMHNVRPVDRIAEARALAGDEGCRVSEPYAVLHRTRFWLLAASLACVADALGTTMAPDAIRALHTEREELTREALRVLREQPLVIGTFIPGGFHAH